MSCRNAARFCVLVVVILLFVVARAQANSASIMLGDPSAEVPISGSADILDDPSGLLDIDDVARNTGFRPGAGSAQPPDDAVRWYRFRAVAQHGSETAQWYLSAPSGCNEADLYRPRPDGGYALQRFGFSVPYALRRSPEASTAIAFDVRQSETIFVRLRCERSLQRLAFATAEIIEDDTYRALLRRLDGSFVALIAITLGLALVTRSAGFALAASTGTLSFFFINAMYLPQWLPTVAFPPLWLVYFIIMVPFVISSVSYCSHFLRLRTDHPRWHRFLIATAVFNLAMVFVWETRVPLAFSDTTIAGEAVNEFVYAIFAMVETGISVVFARRGAKSAWFLAATTAIFPLSCAIGVVLDAAGAPEIVVDLCEYWFWLPESLLLTLAVGYRLRRTAEDREALLLERDAVQTARAQEQQAHIVDIERRNAAFAHFVPTEFLRQLDRPDIIDVQLGDHVERDMAILFTDIRGFTGLSERLSPAETFAFLNEYLARVGPLVRSHGGFIDKYVGDAIVALFAGSPSDALDAAIALQSEVRRLNEARARRGDEPIAVGVGINFGRLMLGTIGEPERFETTVIADAVNVASRLEGLTKVYGVSIIVSGAVVEGLADRDGYGLRPLGEVALRGHQRSETAYELFDGDSHDLVLHKRRTLQMFEQGLALYRRAEYLQSGALFDAIAGANALDRTAMYFRDRSRTMVAREALVSPASAD